MKSPNMNPPDKEPSQDLAVALLDGCTIIGYGKSQHGMNGKNADLDKGGQCRIKSIEIEDPIRAKNMRIVLNVTRYANICAPINGDPEIETKLQEQAEAIVMDWNDYAGEWTGEDYWTFHTNEVINVELSLDEYEEYDDSKTGLIEIAERCANAIYSSEAGKYFEQSMGDLYDLIEELSQPTQ